MNAADIQTDHRGLLRAWESEIRSSYAHNSRLYAHLAEDADLEKIVTFLMWDAHQPPFVQFLRRWVEAVPPSAQGALQEHVAQEEDETHAQLFKTMMDSLLSIVSPDCEFDQEVLDKLNYVFSQECVAEHDAGFFLGAFFATELLSQKRCQQIWDGLLRVGVHRDLEYLKLHAEGDTMHYREVIELMILPGLAAGEIDAASVEAGLRHRLKSSGAYLKWYEGRFL